MAKITAEHGRIYLHWKNFADGMNMSLVYVETGTDKSEPHAMLEDDKGRQERISLRMQQKIGMPSAKVTRLDGTNG